jgi:hypothetical protein
MQYQAHTVTLTCHNVSATTYRVSIEDTHLLRFTESQDVSQH